jgi:hypothetical protein
MDVGIYHKGAKAFQYPYNLSISFASLVLALGFKIYSRKNYSPRRSLFAKLFMCIFFHSIKSARGITTSSSSHQFENNKKSRPISDT